MKKKKGVKAVSINMLIIFVSVLFLTNIIIKPKEIKAITDRETISILEIQPTDKFKLTENGKITSGEESLNKTYNGKKIIVNHITMAEYISKVEQINGKYDVVVIGSYSGNYTAPFTSKPNYLPYGKEINGRLSNPGTIRNANNGTRWNKSYLEYYSENDITNKRSKEIIEIINSGQLVYIATEAMVNGSKIKSNFEIINKQNFIKDKDQNITINNIVKMYLANENKVKYRPVLTINTKPTNDNRNMNYKFNLVTEDNTPVTVNLYLDVNGDGLFKDKELVKKAELTPINNRIENGSLTYTLPNDFVGLLTWKLEVEINEGVTNEKVKSYELGNVSYKAYDGKKATVRVLQVSPSGNILNLSSDTQINTLLKGVSDYEVTIKNISVEEFEKGVKDKTLKLNGNYDMVILGFADSYGRADLSDDAVNEIKDFIKTGQSVMFTHDTLTYRILPYNIINTNDKSSKNITHDFRDIVGQSRYKDVEYNPTEEDIYMKYNISTEQYEKKIIPHDSIKDTNSITYGLSDGILKMFQSNSDAGSYSGEANSIYKINNGLINQYPYEIDNIKVANTHYQWYQLNLEDEDVVPWYTLINDSSGYNKYDARNYYYTYSKGNITYSGTGHSGGFTDNEKKLFINTMVKASRGANHAPTIEVINLDNKQSFSKNQKNIEFEIIPSDMDNDRLTTTITVKNSKGEVVGQQIIYSNKEQGVPITVSIPKNSYDFSNMGGKMTIEIETVDPLKAKAELSREIILVDDPTITLQHTTDKVGYLKGDAAEIKLNAIVSLGYINDKDMTNIRFIPDNVETNKYKLDVGEVNYNNVTFDSSNKPNPESQSKNIKARIKAEGNISISGRLIYTYNGQEITKPYTITLVAQIGKINVSIKDENGQLLKGGTISTASPRNNIPSTINFKGEVEEFSDLISGDYLFKLEQPFFVGDIVYTSVDSGNKAIRLEYDPINSIKTVEFIVTSTPGDNNIPNIGVDLVGAKPNSIYPREEVEITYNIKPEAFTNGILKSDSGTIDEVMFVVDLSKNMSNSNRFSVLQNGITNSILNKNNLNATKFGVIGYNESLSVGDRNVINDPKNVSMKINNNVDSLLKPLFDINDGNSKDGYRQLFQSGNMKISSNDTRNVDGALMMAKDIFNRFGAADKRKAIVLINTGSANYSKALAQEIRSKGYKIISLDLSNEANTNLKNLHTDLGGIISDEENGSDYLVGKIDGGNYNAADTDMSKVEARLIHGLILGRYSDIKPKIYFDLNDNFEYIENSTSNNITMESYQGNKLVFNISSPINYSYTGKIIDGKYEYTASEQKLTFKVKAKEGKRGGLTFAPNPTTSNLDSYKNYMIYNKFNKVESKIPISTPIITVKEDIKNLTHGLYNGIENNYVNIQVNNNDEGFEMVQNSTVTFGAKFTLSGNSIDFNLNIDSKFNQVNSNDIKVYKVKKDSSGADTLIEIVSGSKIITNTDANNFNISIKDFKDNALGEDTDILLIYKARVKEDVSGNESLINTIKFSNINPRDVKITTPASSNENPRLPDLF